MRGLREPTQILKRHVIERRRRSVLHSVALDNDRAPQMSDGQFADSCGLVKGVPEETLDMLEVWVCESMGATWTVDAVEIAGEIQNVPLCQIAMRLTLRESALRAGFRVSHTRARELYRDALATVTENLVLRAQAVHS